MVSTDMQQLISLGSLASCIFTFLWNQNVYEVQSWLDRSELLVLNASKLCLCNIGTRHLLNLKRELIHYHWVLQFVPSWHLVSIIIFFIFLVSMKLFHLIQGNLAFKDKQWQKAISFYTQAIKLSSNNATYYNNRAAAYLELGR